MQKSKNSSAVERVTEMEKCFDNAVNVLTALRTALDSYVQCMDNIDKLRKYYSSNEWKEDYQADEKGAFPSELKRGVLSEDGIWNMLEEISELSEEMKNTAEKMNG